MSLGRRDGATFDPDRDTGRLNLQAEDVWRHMRDGRWHTLNAISRATGHPEASISSRLRDFRKPRYGGHEVQRRRVTQGLNAYRIVPNHD